MPHHTAITDGFELRLAHEVMRVEAWGPDSARVRIGQHRLTLDDDFALMARPPQPSSGASATWDGQTATLVNGNLTVMVTQVADNGTPALLARFVTTGEQRELLAETRQHFCWPGAHSFDSLGHGVYTIRQQFAAYPGERLYGMGQRSHGRLDHKGLSVELMHRNGEVSIPFVLSSRGYGFLWNNPGIGRVEFAENATSWSMQAARQLDYWVTTGPDPATILGQYADAVGHAPEMPSWALGLWQSRLRYESQEEILDVVREHRRRGIPLSVIVSDYFHWTAMGDYRFDPAEYPDPHAMMTELEEAGVQLMVSVWPTISPLSENYEELRDSGFLVGVNNGVEFHQIIKDKSMPTALPVAFYDATNPAAQDWLWSHLKQAYFDRGIRVWWLDASEPEITPAHPANLNFYSGPGDEVMNLYPRDNARGLFRHLVEEGGAETVLLSRSAWAGQAQFATAVWSGDIAATWDALAAQIRAGLSIGISGIPWWTTDIGGFHGGNPDDAAYRELVIRWFQFATFCPLLRMHGHRDPRDGIARGGPNEVWSYGREAYTIMRTHIDLRERLRPYLSEVMGEAARRGLPAMRPLFLDHPHDEAAWSVEDEFCLGRDLLVAPVTSPGARDRLVYFPGDGDWCDVVTGLTFHGGSEAVVEAPLERTPVFARAGVVSPLRG